MSHRSTTELLVLHAVRLLGFADTPKIATHAGTDVETAALILSAAEAHGWVQHTAFLDLEGWFLTDHGKQENERQLAAERVLADPQGVIPAMYREFLPLNARLLEAVTAWQIKPSCDNPTAPNDHTDAAWDAHVLDKMTMIGHDLEPIADQLSRVLARFDGYTTRYENALGRAQSGQHDWIDKTEVDSCHRVWFQLHEDLVATLGIHRLSETDSDGA